MCDFFVYQDYRTVGSIVWHSNTPTQHDTCLPFSSSFPRGSALSKSKKEGSSGSAIGSSSGSWYDYPNAFKGVRGCMVQSLRVRSRGEAGGRTSRYGCFRASETSMRFFGLNVRHFSIKSMACRVRVSLDQGYE